MQWLKQSLQAMAELPEAAQRIRIPVLVLQATEDPIVSLEPQTVFIRLAPHPGSQLQRVQGSYHEVLMEKDEIRGPAMASAFDFFAQHHEAEPIEEHFSASPRPKHGKRLAR